jgi:heme exporter protein D
VHHLVLPGGKYAIYIWPAYGATALAFAWMILDTLGRARRWRRRVGDLERAAEEGPPFEPVPRSELTRERS